MSDPRVSVVVPTYDRADRVGGAVESALAQTVSDLEVLVVNDGSTDRTRAVVDALAAEHDRVRAFHNDENRGISHTRNRGIEAARGEFVCQLDDDDRWRPKKLESQLELMDSLGDDYCGCHTAGLVRDAEGGVVREVRAGRGAPDDRWPGVLVQFDAIPHSSHLVRRSCLDAVGGYDESVPRGVDWDLTVRLAKRWQFGYVDRVLVERRYDGDNVSGDPAFGDPAYEVAIRERLAEKYRDELDAHPDTREQFDARLAKQRGLAALERGERRAAIRHLLGAARREPSTTNLATLALGALGPGAYRTGWRLKRALGGDA